MEQNIWRVQGKWVQLENTMGREGAYRRTMGRFYVVMVQAVLLFGSKTWVMTPSL